MSIPYTHGDFTTPRATTDSYVEYPFIEQGDNATKIYHLVCKVNRADYAPLALDTTMASASNADVIALPFTADAAAYYVGDTTPQSIDGAIVQFERIFSNIPVTRNNVFGGTYAFTYPGVRADSTDGTVRTVSSPSTASNVTSLPATNTVTVGDVIAYRINSTIGAITLSVQGMAHALPGTTTSVVKIPAINIGTTFVDGTLTELTIQPRAQKSIPSGSVIDYTYYLPGVTPGITTFDDVDETDTFTAFSARTGESVSTLDVNTIPDGVTYQAQVTAGEYLVVSSEVTRFRGNIIQRADVKVRAL